MSTFNIKADFTNGVKIEGGFISFVQQDTQTCELALELLDKGNIIDMSNRRATFSVVTPSGATIEETHLAVVDATLGKLKLVMPGDMILETGKYKAQIQLYPLESYARESTLIFNYSVTPSLMSDQKLLATERFGTLEGLIVTVEGLQTEVSGNVETIEKAQVAAEKAKDDAILSASYSIQSATSAKEAAQAAAAMTGVLDEVVEQARQSALASTDSAQASKASADEADRAARTALAATDKANTAVSTANKALADVNTALIDITEAKQVIDHSTKIANEAANEATNAITQANQLAQAVGNLSDKVNQANSTANNNLQAIDIIANKADSASSKAEVAVTKADEVTKKAETALTVAENVVVEANNANLAANKAVVDATAQANISKTEATKATTEANKAKLEADRAVAEVNKVSGAIDRLDAKNLAQDTKIATKYDDVTANIEAGTLTFKAEGIDKKTVQVGSATVSTDKVKFEDGESLTDKHNALDSKVDNKITLDNLSQSNFNFIENKVVQNGLFEVFGYEFKTTNPSTIVIQPKATKQVITTIYKPIKRHSTQFDILLSSNSFFIGFTNNILHLSEEGSNISIVPNDYYNNIHVLVVTIENNNISVNLDGKKYDFKKTVVNKTLICPFSYAEGTDFISDTHIYGVYSYNRQLTPQEIQHNFSVLNNSPSVNQLQITDSNNQTSILSFGTDGNHVEMSSGRTLEEEYMGVLEGMSQEYTSTGASITVNDGLKARLVGAEIQGQTVKNYCTTKGEFSRDVTNGDIYRQVKLYSKSEISKTYTIFVDILENTLNKGIYINGGGEFTSTYHTIPSGTKGLYKWTFQASKESEYFTFYMSALTGTFSVGYVLFVEGDGKNIDGNYFTGLSSTVATISNNGIKYPFYEPVIQGETKVIDGKLVSLQPSIEGLAPLGSVPSISDTHDLASGKSVINTGEYLVNDTSEIIKRAENNNTIRFEILAPNVFSSTTRTESMMSNIFPTNKDVYNQDVEGVGYIPNVEFKSIQIRILKSKLTTTDVNGFKQWLQANPVTVRYQLATPITQQLTPSQVKAYDAHKKQILLSGVGGVNDKVSMDSTGALCCVENTKLIVLNGSGSVNVAQDIGNYIRFEVLIENGNSSVAPMCDLFEGKTWSWWVNTGSVTPTEGLFVHGDKSRINIVVLKSKLTTQDANGFKAWLAQNPVTVVYQLETPTTYTIPKEVNAPVLTDKSNVLSAGEAVGASSFKVNVPVNKFAELENRLKALENVTIEECLK